MRPRGRSLQSRLTAQRIVPSPSTMPGAPTPMPRIGWWGRVRISSIRSWTRATAWSPSAPCEVAGDPFADLAAEVEEGRGEGALAEVEGDDLAGVVDERDERRLLAAGGRAAADVAGEAVALEVGDELPDRGAGQAGEAGDLGAARWGRGRRRHGARGRRCGHASGRASPWSGTRCVPCPRAVLHSSATATLSSDLAKPVAGRTLAPLAGLCPYPVQRFRNRAARVRRVPMARLDGDP